MTAQKGFDLLFDTLPDVLIEPRCRAASRSAAASRATRASSHSLQQRFPDRVVFHRGYNEELSHLIEAASDMFLMPSLYEPCGLNQMYSLKYGTVPIVRRTGGLADSVQMWDPATRTGTGIVFNDFDAPAVRWALHTALDLLQGPDALAADHAQRHGARISRGTSRARSTSGCTRRAASCSVYRRSAGRSTVRVSTADLVIATFMRRQIDRAAFAERHLAEHADVGAAPCLRARSRTCVAAVQPRHQPPDAADEVGASPSCRIRFHPARA